MDGAFGELLYYLIKYGFLLISIIGITRLVILRKDKRKHITTKVITSFFFIVTLYLFVGSYISRKEKMKELSGEYKIKYFNCEDCKNCIAQLNNNGTYTLLKKGEIIDKGGWDFTEPFLTTFIIFNDGIEQEIRLNNTILSIKNNNCQEYWRNQNLEQEMDGIVVNIDSTNTNYGMFAFDVVNNSTKDTILYEPKYIHHGILNNKIELGDYIKKEKNSMVFFIEKVDGVTLIVKENVRLKESIDEIINN